MTLPNYTWIKLPINNLYDSKFMQLNDATLGIYIKLYLLAGQADAGGLLCNHKGAFNKDDLTWQLRIHTDVLNSALSELLNSGFLQEQDGAYTIVMFMDEQGPGDNVKRAEWRERQRRHREKSDGGIDSEKKIIDKIRGEEISHGDVTVTSPATSTQPSTPSFSQFFNALTPKIIAQYGEVDNSRLKSCIDFWGELANSQGWNPENQKVIIELYAPGKLEARMKRISGRPNIDIPNPGALCDLGQRLKARVDGLVEIAYDEKSAFLPTLDLYREHIHQCDFCGGSLNAEEAQKAITELANKMLARGREGWGSRRPDLSAARGNSS